MANTKELEQRVMDLERKLEQQAAGVDLDAVERRAEEAHSKLDAIKEQHTQLVAAAVEARERANRLVDVGRQAQQAALTAQGQVDSSFTAISAAERAAKEADDALRTARRAIAKYREAVAQDAA